MDRDRRDREDAPREYLYGVHPVEEALAADSRRVERILVAREAEDNRLGRILKEARKAGIPITRLPKEGLARKAGRKAVHQGVVAVVSPVRYLEPAEIARTSMESGHGLLVLLSGVEDPRNLGAVIRSAAAAGADGVILTGETAAGVTPGAVKTSAGAAERVPVGRDRKPVRAIRELKQAGFSVIAMDHRADLAWDQVDLDGPVVLVAGGEGRGLSRSVAMECHHRVALPLAAEVESLNLSVAVGILLYEVLRQRKDRVSR
ncbi:MAG: 23S rRNA (guanosine(2251)-2'-O)-methyltransferase RlmB [Acidobacteria bacterium]|uniref:23S rRNA (Guanosine(2251)-2'-O)-methyltransferase RlmB n=1 Tax=Candidatus Polarisedimenticola svalbardensis TaxID=2886004 RepID=A0A8J6Y8V2_9BACT|nr:23S rRNA (guanosine(2251)-2'-O)-methyltransferase RlmB [Candidatus Polarisedimenticola svalbardensis]